MTKHRSPAYPAVNLKDAVDLVGKLYSKASKHTIGVNVVAEQWGYRGIASASPQLAALKQYGLLEETKAGGDRMVRLTPRARDIATDHQGTTRERVQALEEAALHPAVFKEMWGKWGGELPPEGEIRRYLERDRGFNPKYVGRVAANYRDTLEFAMLLGKTSEDRDKSEADEDHFEVDTLNNVTGPETGNNALRVGSLVQWTSQGQQQFPKPLPITRIDERAGELFAYFEGKGHAPMSELTFTEPNTKTPEINLLRPNATPPKPPADDDLLQLGIATERTTLDEGPVVLTMPEKLGPDSVQDFQRWVDGLSSRAHRRAGGAHKSMPLQSGGTVHLVRRHGNDKWQIKSYDFSWLAGMQLMTATVYAAANGWDLLEFDTPQDAVEFVETKPIPSVVPKGS